jgi:peptidoglycan-associated lipoprotein
MTRPRAREVGGIHGRRAARRVRGGLRQRASINLNKDMIMETSRRQSRFGVGAALVGVVLATAPGCASKPKPAETAGIATEGLAAVPAASAKQDTVTPTSGSIHIDEKIMKICGDVPTAHFAFDSAKIQPDAGVVLDALARCFVTGPAKGRNMKVIGHADPRGEHEYNFALGQRRAGSVGAYLSTKGMDASRVQASSKGDTDATGTDEAGWARDRKVDILLAD